MGWKAVREAYDIGHIVKMQGGMLLIGSSYIGDIIVIAPDGTITKRDGRGTGDLARYQHDIEADPTRFAALLAANDVFDRSIVVYTWEGADIIERRCERTDWPNVTHDGHLMHDNTYTTDRDEAIEWARRDADAALRIYSRNVADAERELEARRTLLKQAEEVSARLAAEHPPTGGDWIGETG